MTPKELVGCAEHAMKEQLDSIDFELTGAIIYRYKIRTLKCKEYPFSEEERENLGQLINLIERLQSELNEPSAVVNSRLE